MCENIPDNAILNRLIFHPGMISSAGELNVINAFTFSSDGLSNTSVIWRKYCLEMDCVNGMGCKKQTKDIERKKENQNFDPDQYKYSGSIECCAEKIRSVQGNNGTSVEVVHAPQNEQGRHHSEIRLKFSEEKMTKNKLKGEIREIKRRLFRVFSPLISHSCP